jgi:hypothetical protein
VGELILVNHSLAEPEGDVVLWTSRGKPSSASEGDDRAGDQMAPLGPVAEENVIK